MSPLDDAHFVRPTTPADFAGIRELCLRVYPSSPPWSNEQLASHLRVFPDGQLVAVERATGQVVGMAASLVILWDDYDIIEHLGRSGLAEVVDRRRIRNPGTG